MLTPHQLFLVEGSNFHRGLTNCFLKHERVRDRVSLLGSCKSFSELTNEKIIAENPEFILFSYMTSVPNLVSHLDRLRKNFPDVALLCYSFIGSKFERNILLKHGVRAILSTDDDPLCILDAMDELVNQDYYMNASVDEAAIKKAKQKHIQDDGLLLHEIALIQLLSIGLSRDACGKHLNHTPSTLSNDISNVHSKTGTVNDMQMTRYSLLYGYIEPEIIVASARMDVINLKGNYTRVEEQRNGSEEYDED